MKLKIDDYGTWISSQLDKTLRPTRSKAAKLVDDASKSLNEAREYYEGLAQKGEHDMATKKDAASYRAARVIGHAAQQAEASLKQIQIPDTASWESLKVLKDLLSTSSRSIRSMRDSASRELSGFYLLDQRAFGIMVDRVAKSAERLSAFLDGEGANLQRSKTMSGIVDDILSARKGLNETLREKESVSRELQAARASVQDLVSKIDELSTTGDLREVLEIEKELRKESRAFRSETLAHLQRPLRRLGDLAQRGDFAMGSDEREALTKFIESPYRTFLSRSTGAYVEKILGNMKRAIEAGTMEFKPRKVGRVSAQLNQLLGTGRLVEKQEKGRGLVGRRHVLLQNKACKENYEWRKGLLLKIEEARKQELHVEEKLASVVSRTEMLDRRLTELLRLTEQRTREYLGQTVELERS